MSPGSSAIDHLWAISHGTSNISMPVTGAGAVAMVLSNCIQQNWNREAASRLAASVEELVASVRISSLAFLPDRSIRDYLAARESDDFVTAAGAASAILAEEKHVTITAGGYSMWPAIRPGDRVAIGPLKELVPVRGDIVALRRDGGYVVHRVKAAVISRGSWYLHHTQGDAVTQDTDDPVLVQ
ncbi:MAG: S24/S26 family peptidase [Marinilabiliales bacterium]|nr:S24/S26 family peptidase [Marinilabiliales bacterium]